VIGAARGTNGHNLKLVGENDAVRHVAQPAVFQREKMKSLSGAHHHRHGKYSIVR
jgi:hypothetical protein